MLCSIFSLYVMLSCIQTYVLNYYRRCLRRQSARFTSEEHKLKENLFVIKDLKMHEDCDATSKGNIEQEHDKCGSKPEPQNLQRMSLGRPSRRAAEKVQSYKEVPLNIKMRRPE